MWVEPDSYDGLVVEQSLLPLADAPTSSCAEAGSLYLFVLVWASGGTGLYR